jgi:superfamily II DNA/RNA helicase
MKEAMDILESIGGRQVIEQAAADARNRFGANVLAAIAPEAAWTGEDASLLRKYLDATELAALTLCGEVNTSRLVDDDAKLLRDLCSFAFEFHRALGDAPEQPQRLKQALNATCEAVLSNRVDDWRRWRLTAGWPVPDTKAEPSNWATHLFEESCDAFLRLVRKDGWADLRAVAEFVARLREQQSQHEAAYLAARNGIKQVAALEVITFYHFAKAVETAAEFTGHGRPNDALGDVELHMRHAIEAADVGGIIEWAILLRWLRAALRRLVETTLWHQLAAYNHKVTEFKHALTRDEADWRPVFELLPPQQDAVHQVMSLALRAVVVQMPTSSGKTLLAQFRIIQAKTNYPQGWIAYILPTRALVNQITSRLRRSFAPLNIRVELASPAEEFDAFEDQLFEGDKFDVLVTTPEKLDLIIRGAKIDLEKRPLSLVVLDEAHHISDTSRGLRAELLLATINQRSRKDTSFLLLTPFIKNARDVARWLEPDTNRSAEVKTTLGIDWRPNDLLVACSWREGKRRQWTVQMQSLHTTKQTIELEKVINLEPVRARESAISKENTRGDVAAETARILSKRKSSTLLMVLDPANAWSVADKLRSSAQPASKSDKRDLVRRFVADEYGESFPLCSLLDQRIGVHHGGLSDEARVLVEWLMEKNELDYLVATSTLAQGLNFDLTNLVLASLSVRMGTHTRPMSYAEFWNAAGRAGRLEQNPLGVVAIATANEKQRTEARKFMADKVADLVSAMETLLADVERLGWDLDLVRLGRNDPKWSAFVQYLSHCYRQLGSAEKFSAETEKILTRTYAFTRLGKTNPANAQKLLEAVRAYGAKLASYPTGILTLVDTTGFSPESIVALASNKQEYLPKTWSEWSPSQLFRTGGGISAIIGRLLTIKEADLEGGAGIDHVLLSKLVVGWVNGQNLATLAKLVPKKKDKSQEDHLTDVARIIFRSVSRTSSWGLGAVQRLAEFDESKMSESALQLFKSIPSMIYYGCQSVQGVLMRSQGVPRVICESLGASYRQSVKRSDNEIEAARRWLQETKLSDWETAARNRSKLSGAEHRKIWQIINGFESQ